MTGGRPDSPPQLVVMGVSAVGKSTVAAALAAELGLPWIDADSLHPPENVVKMSTGLALEDEDRWPWLQRVGEVVAEGSDGGIVMACSALRRVYRDRIRAVAPHVRFVHLHGEQELLRARALARAGHFMPPSLLASQLATLEHLDDDEAGVVVTVDAAVGDIVKSVKRWVGAHER